MAVYNSSYRTTRKKIREKTTERIDSERGKFRNQSFVPDGGPRVREKGKKITRRIFLAKAILAI